MKRDVGLGLTLEEDNRQSERALSLSRAASLHRIFTGLLLVGSTVLGLGLAEVYFRLLDPQSIVPRYVEASDFGIKKNIGHVQGVMSTAEFRHGFTTNSQGFRGQTEYAPVKPPRVYRIIVLGDSVTLGQGVEDDETFAAVAQ